MTAHRLRVTRQRSCVGSVYGEATYTLGGHRFHGPAPAKEGLAPMTAILLSGSTSWWRRCTKGSSVYSTRSSPPRPERPLLRVVVDEEVRDDG